MFMEYNTLKIHTHYLLLGVVGVFGLVGSLVAFDFAVEGEEATRFEEEEAGGTGGVEGRAVCDFTRAGEPFVLAIRVPFFYCL